MAGITSVATVALSGRYGDTGGAPTRFDVFWIGGSDSAVFAPGLDRNRIFRPALPAALQLGARAETYRAELLFSGVPLVLYAERLRAWGLPTVVVTHDPADAEALGGDVLVMERGQVTQRGRLPELAHGPKTEFVRRFVAGLSGSA